VEVKMAEINGIRVPFIPITNGEENVKNKAVKESPGFDVIFREELEKIKFSNHALKRLETRNIQLSSEEVDKIQTAVEKAELKGAKDSLVMMNDTVFIINIPNRTVVTAMPLGSSEENIFTNIDSFVLA
jgi:flagellar operon protein